MGRTPPLFHRLPVRLLPLLLLVFLAACGDNGSSPVGPKDPGDPGDPPPPPPVSADSATATIGAAGGSVLLPDGAGVVFPAGALATSMPVTVTRGDAASYVDPSGDVQRTLLTTRTSVSEFNADVEIRVPLPEGATEADSLGVFAGVVDEESGTVTMERATIRMIDGKPFLVVVTNHFTTRLFEWLFGKTPPANATLTVPYYNQGSSPYCWAASLHMVTQATDFSQVRLLADIIGKVGIDEGGIGAVSFRTNSAIASVVKDRTGVRPERKMWDYVNAGVMRDYLRREIGVNGHPVALFSSKWEHAVVVLGYTGYSTFIVHDPASTSTGAAGYQTKEWKEFVDDMERNDKLVTLVVPRPVRAGMEPVALNFLSGAVDFVKPKRGDDDPSAIYAYRWDYTNTNGYSYRNVSSQTPLEVLSGGVTMLRTGGEIQISNASRTTSREVSLWLDVTALGAPTGTGRFSTQRSLTVGPNATANLKVPDIVVDTFRYNTNGTMEYALTVSALTEGSTVDRQTIYFTLASVTPELTAISPSTAAIGDRVTLKGKNLGLLAHGNAVKFKGDVVDTVVAWSDDAVTVVVPKGAESGPVVLVRGEVESNPVDFVVAEYTTVAGSMGRSYDEDFGAGVTVNVAGDWSFTGVGAKLASGPDALYHYTFHSKKGEVSQLSLTFSGGASPAEMATSDGGLVKFKDLEWHFDAAKYGAAFTVDESGSGGDRTYTFTLDSYDNLFCVRVYFGLPGDYYDKKGDLYYQGIVNERTPGVFCVEAGS